MGLVTVQQLPLKALELTLEEIPHGMLAEYMLASAACFPAFRPREIEGRSFIDGGYRDNMPCGLAQRMGAEEALCVNVDGVGFVRPAPEGLAVRTIESHWDLGSILNFDPPTAARNMELGYWDTLRAFGRVRGSAYALRPEGAAYLEEILAGRYRPLMAAAVEGSPALTLAERTALNRFERCTDPELLPAELAAEEAGVDPTCLWDGPAFCSAFITGFGRERAEKYRPLFYPGERADRLGAAAAAARQQPPGRADRGGAVLRPDRGRTPQRCGSVRAHRINPRGGRPWRPGRAMQLQTRRRESHAHLFGGYCIPGAGRGAGVPAGPRCPHHPHCGPAGVGNGPG